MYNQKHRKKTDDNDYLIKNLSMSDKMNFHSSSFFTIQTQKKNISELHSFQRTTKEKNTSNKKYMSFLSNTL